MIGFILGVLSGCVVMAFMYRGSAINQLLKEETVDIPKTHNIYTKVLSRHAIIQTPNNIPAFYCPVHMSLSYHPKDVEHGWCAICQKFINVKEALKLDA